MCSLPQIVSFTSSLHRRSGLFTIDEEGQVDIPPYLELVVKSPESRVEEGKKSHIIITVFFQIMVAAKK